MEVYRTNDLDYVRSVLTHPKIWRHIVDDGNGLPDEFNVPDSDSIYWLVPNDGSDLGVFMVHPVNNFMFEVHTALLPEAYGDKAKIAAKKLIEWVFENTQCLKLITHVPEYNRLAYKFALNAGMKEEGLITKSFMRNGKLIDQYVLGIGKE